LRRFWIVGKGFNEYDKKEEQIRIFRWEFPGKKRYFEFSCPFTNMETLYLESQRGTVKLNLYLVLKEQRKILLTQLGSIEILSPTEIEYFSSNLARFLKIPLRNKNT
jgi:hypothetical protein